MSADGSVFEYRFLLLVVGYVKEDGKGKSHALEVIASAELIVHIAVVLTLAVPEHLVYRFFHVFGFFFVFCFFAELSCHLVGEHVGIVVKAVGRKGMHRDAHAGIDAVLTVAL